MTTAQPGPQRININTMSPEALSQLRHSVSAEVEYMSESANALRKAMSLFEQARVAAEKMSECKEGQESLIPITNSVG
jgi:prefoldin subunit 5